eukprot:gene5633-5872_t
MEAQHANPGDGSDVHVEGAVNHGTTSAEGASQGNFIIRFSSYHMVAELERRIQQGLKHLKGQWQWVDRANKALQYPSDFALISVSRPGLEQVQQALERVPGFKDLHPDKVIHGALKWQPEGPLAAAFSDAALPAGQAKVLWDEGFSGQGIKVGVFDTGIREDHPHIRNIKERTNWTHQNSLSDGLGHGSFVAGVIGSQDSTCPGFAPDVLLYTFKVFTDDQVSYTSWFMDAFNYAIASKLHIINLSIGGPDFLDAPFVDKVCEVTSNGIIMISAIGNDGPLYGTLNNPADQSDVIGVGGIDNNDDIASFSSRGMTTWELPVGTGRIKPDVMAYAKDVSGSKIQGGCRSLSGTSVASPVVAGAVCLLASTVPEERRWLLNPASMKQALVEGAVRLPKLNMHEQGNGRINLPASQAILASYTPRASLIPKAIDLTDCPYFWPHCRQPLYAFALPVALNATVINGMGATGFFDGEPQYQGTDEGGKLLHVTFTHSDVLWPWSGYLAVYIEVSPAAVNFSGNATGIITFTITSPPHLGSNSSAPQTSKVTVPLKVLIRPTPPRSKRVIWDVLHSIKYPPGYVPRDNLDIKTDVLDWHGDHPFTNYHEALNALRDAGLFVEVLSSPSTCFDPLNYGAYLVLDAEEEWYKEEVAALESAVKESGMALIVFAEWYHEQSLRQMKFFDDNTRSWWTPITGGANVPALNDLLAPHNITLGERILQGTTKVAGREVLVSYGTNIARFPAGGFLHLSKMNDVSGKGPPVSGEFAAFGALPSGKGWVAVMGDTNCLDSSHMVSPCFDLLVAVLKQLMQGVLGGITPEQAKLSSPYVAADFKAPPSRRDDVNLTRYSWQSEDARQRDQQQQHQHRMSVGQTMTLATFFCVAGLIGLLVVWHMRSRGAGGKWGRKWGGYAAVPRRPANAVDV